MGVVGHDVRWRVIATVVAAVGALTLVAHRGGPEAVAGLVTSPAATGAVGVAAGQTARLNAASLAHRKCSADLAFRDGDGHVVFHHTTTIAPRHVASLDVAASSLAPDETGRTEIVGVVRLTGGNPCGEDEVIATLEVFDTATGHTVFIWGPPRVIPVR